MPRMAHRSREMTNRLRDYANGEAAPDRADKPHRRNAYSRAFHGPSHEIVKKPFATPKGGD